jgi:hypothetical protein
MPRKRGGMPRLSHVERIQNTKQTREIAMFRSFALAAATALGLASTASAQFGLNVVVGGARPAPVVVAPAPVFVQRPVVVQRPVFVPSPVIVQRHYHVEYRLPWRERVFHCPIEAGQFERHQELSGYEAHTIRHGLHYDVRYRPRGWQHYRTVGSDFAAHQLERQLELRGMQARVVHH